MKHLVQMDIGAGELVDGGFAVRILVTGFDHPETASECAQYLSSVILSALKADGLQAWSSRDGLHQAPDREQ